MVITEISLTLKFMVITDISLTFFAGFPWAEMKITVCVTVRGDHQVREQGAHLRLHPSHEQHCQTRGESKISPFSFLSDNLIIKKTVKTE